MNRNHYKTKSLLKDGLARAAFFTPIMAFNELIIAGMEPKDVLKTRVYSFLLNLAIGTPYKKYRQWFSDKLNTDSSSSDLRKNIVDTSAFVLSQAILYPTLLISSGAKLENLLNGVPSGIMLSALTGRKYGKTIDDVNDFIGDKTTLQKNGKIKNFKNLFQNYVINVGFATLLTFGGNYIINNLDLVLNNSSTDYSLNPVPKMIDGFYWSKQQSLQGEQKPL